MLSFCLLHWKHLLILIVVLKATSNLCSSFHSLSLIETAFGTIFRITGGFRSNVLRHRQLSEAFGFSSQNNSKNFWKLHRSAHSKSTVLIFMTFTFHDIFDKLSWFLPTCHDLTWPLTLFLSDSEWTHLTFLRPVIINPIRPVTASIDLSWHLI